LLRSHLAQLDLAGRPKPEGDAHCSPPRADRRGTASVPWHAATRRQGSSEVALDPIGSSVAGGTGGLGRWRSTASSPHRSLGRKRYNPASRLLALVPDTGRTGRRPGG